MKKYTTSEIITRAMQLADLENSDFISDNEKVALLNEAYQSIYQKLVDAGDQSYVKHAIDVEDGDILPDDFWQLKSIYGVDLWGWKRPLNKSEQCGYVIKNNRIRLYNTIPYVKVELEYFPVPQTLTVKEAIQNSPFPEDWITSCHTLYAINVDGTVFLRDLTDTSVEHKLGTTEELLDIAIYENAVIYTIDNIVHLLELTTGLDIILTGSEWRPVYNKDKIYLTNGTVLKTLSGTILESELQLTIHNDSFFVIDENDKYHEVRSDKFDNIDIPEHATRFAWNNGLYIVTTGNELVLVNDKVRYIETDWSPISIISNKSVMTKRGITGNYYVESMIADTILDYPNTMFYTILAYMLAITFKTKQGSDTAQLGELYASAANQFFDQLGNDANAYYTIQNKYARGR